ncbi:2-C-methyl-D-erythritol 4-phosphate cytidylyltransferase [Porphyromonadaceae bacterium OttesenSCG-928-L07]|nr:2-C-methyl-D-erythritol 4-phosphate cytidylyltransferase [Porphyromonadaceae bacterium OttesenSCG-928-L07]MDL2251272.1 2-C-methyl-D-erythritol 4-phosphate cytidylyltransferase [Odoribacter sp. OttesenSCG-928-J03]
MRKNVGIILANGKGLRLGGDIPKQFLTLAGKSVLEHSIAAFQANPCIDEITIVANPTYKERIESSIAQHHFDKVKHIIEGGKERYHSSLNALRLYAGIDCNLLIHDAVRPLVSQHIINEVAEALKSFNAVNVAIPVSDTIIETDESKQYITNIPERARLYQVQTPQGFRRSVLEQAFSIAMRDELFQATDDCSIIKKYLPDEPIRMVPGDIHNIKITWPEDLAIAEIWLKNE